jgi:hypothetical protein
MGRSFANLAPNKESHPIHPTQELPGSALREVLVPNTGGLDYQLCNVLGGVARPSFGCIEGNDAKRIVELPSQ